MQKRFFQILLFVTLVFVSDRQITAGQEAGNNDKQLQEPVNIIFFSAASCEDCLEVKETMPELIADLEEYISIEVYDIETVTRGPMGSVGVATIGNAGFGMGMSVTTGSPAGLYKFQVGPDEGMDVDFEAGNVSLTGLRLSALSVDSIEGAMKALTPLAEAIDSVASQRALFSSQVSRLGFIYNANDSYKNNIASSESRIRSVDFAEETSIMTNSQIMTQTSIAVMAQANSSRATVLALLQ